MPAQYQHVNAGARQFVGLPYGCDDNDVAREMLRMMGLPVPTSVLGDTALWFRQLANEVALDAAAAPAEAVAVLPKNRREILRLLNARSPEDLGEVLPVLIARAVKARGRR
jgi:hypothetical protein